MKDPSAHTLTKARQIMGETPHRSIRKAEGEAHMFCSVKGPAEVTLEDALRLMNEGLIRMQRLTDADGWEYVLCGIEHYAHAGEHLAAVSTFKDIHIDPKIRHRFGKYDPPPKPVDTKAVVSCWQNAEKTSIQTTSHPRKDRKRTSNGK